MKGILVRIAVDSSYGNWNAPVNPGNNDFVHIPIPENESHTFKKYHVFKYDQFLPALKEFSVRNNLDPEIQLPKSLYGINTHLDPDFTYLTYGDNGKRRGKQLRENFQENDFIVFYAGLKPVKEYKYPCLYAIVGFYHVKEVRTAGAIGFADAMKNAHTRILNPEPTDVIVFAKEGHSGRLNRCIPIGEYRAGAYRVRNDLLMEWGGLSVKNGYIQRSAVPPTFDNPGKFLQWFENQDATLINSNN